MAKVWKAVSVRYTMDDLHVWLQAGATEVSCWFEPIPSTHKSTLHFVINFPEIRDHWQMRAVLPLATYSDTDIVFNRDYELLTATMVRSSDIPYRTFEQWLTTPYELPPNVPAQNGTLVRATPRKAYWYFGDISECLQDHLHMGAYVYRQNWYGYNQERCIVVNGTNDLSADLLDDLLECAHKYQNKQVGATSDAPYMSADEIVILTDHRMREILDSDQLDAFRTTYDEIMLV